MRAEFRGIPLDVRRNHIPDGIDLFFESTAFHILYQEVIVETVILSDIFAMIHKLHEKRSADHHFHRSGRVDRIVDEKRRIVDGVRHTERIRRESEIVIPWEHRYLAVFFVKKIVVSRSSKIAIEIDDKRLNREVP